MRVCIHRGAREIGGNCVELEVAGKRLVIDIGRPLEASLDDQVELPAITGLTAVGDGSLVGVVLSHPHQDRSGLVQQVDPSVPCGVPKLGSACFAPTAATRSTKASSPSPAAGDSSTH